MRSTHQLHAAMRRRPQTKKHNTLLLSRAAHHRSTETSSRCCKINLTIKSKYHSGNKFKLVSISAKQIAERERERGWWKTAATAAANFAVIAEHIFFSSFFSNVSLSTCRCAWNYWSKLTGFTKSADGSTEAWYFLDYAHKLTHCIGNLWLVRIHTRCTWWTAFVTIWHYRNTMNRDEELMRCTKVSIYGYGWDKMRFNRLKSPIEMVKWWNVGIVAITFYTQKNRRRWSINNAIVMHLCRSRSMLLPPTRIAQPFISSD